MATHDYDIANQSGANFRTDLNNALDAIVSNNSNGSSPSTTFAYMWWVDTGNNVLKLRNSANNAWITLPMSITASNTITPTLNMGTGVAEDVKIVFDGNAQDFYIALDDSADDLLIGKGSTVGTTPAIAIDENLLTTLHGGLTMVGTTPTLTIGDGGAEDTKIVFDGNAQDFYIGLDDSADDLIIGKGSTVGTTPAIAIDGSENVGIACTPYFPFDVQLNSSRRIGFNYSDSQNSILSHDGSGNIETLGLRGNTILFYSDYDASNPDGVERARIDESGNVGIGTTSPSGLLDVTGPNATGVFLDAQNTGASGITFERVTAGSQPFNHFKFFNGDIRVSNMNKISIPGSGVTNINVDSAGDFTTSTSDKRLKTDLGEQNVGLDIIKSIDTVKYFWTDDETKTPRIGFYAQDVYAIQPELVTKNLKTTLDEDENVVPSLDEEGNEDYSWGMHQDGLIAALWKGMQEQQEQIESLQQKIEVLENGN